jgi:UDP-N-acetylglucosamine 2-epimerase (non-hydrolysing)
MKIITVVGARPNFMKVSPIVSAIQRYNGQDSGGTAPAHQSRIDHILLHTGQHYDQRMSDAFFADLGLPHPDIYLGIGSGSHAFQTAEIMKKFEEIVEAQRPDLIIVVGDVNSTVACALAASKVIYDTNGARPLIAHVESGLRSYDRGMPEEINRIVTDHLSDLLFVTEESGLNNLRREGVPETKIHFVGNTMIDTLLAFEAKAEQSTILHRLNLNGAQQALNESVGGRGEQAILPYALVTLHRPSNVDTINGLQSILGALEEFKDELTFVFPVHPRTKKRMEEFGLMSQFISGSDKGIRLIDPLGYLDFICLMKHAKIVLTDSGGIQEETTCLGVPCVTIRENTERPITLTEGTNVLAGLTKGQIVKAIQEQLNRKAKGRVPPLWDGRAARRILDVILKNLDNARHSI